MRSVDLAKHASDYYDGLDDNSRELSWEQCYRSFGNAFNNDDPNYDELSLRLGFYLASWGMYRGRAFLLQKDYSVHEGAVKIILDTKYRDLYGVECKQYIENEQYLCLLDGLYDEIYSHYVCVRKTIGDNRYSNPTDTLVTKVLLGTLGCVPAFDSVLKCGLKGMELAQSYSKKLILSIARQYQNNERGFDVFKDRKIGETTYPQMKLVDMGIWKYGKTIMEEQKRHEK